MKKILTILIIVLSFLSSCEKEDENEKGEVLFCTNSYIINCPFAIEISIEDEIIDTLTAASEYFDNNCTCHDSSSIGLLIEMGSGIYNYSAKELNCSATNRTNNWSGDFTIKNDSCKMIFLDIEK